MIPYGRQEITEADIEAVVSVLKSDFLTQGGQTLRFEEVVKESVGAKHAIAMNSATSALHVACLALGLGPQDCLWTSPITFVASANCARYCGASVDFVDIDPQTYNICPLSLAEKLANADINGTLPKAVVAVHMAGQSCDMAAIKTLSEKYGFKIIEDASHAIGGRYKGHFVGACDYSDVTIFSFHPVKIITTGEGGMALTNCEYLAHKMSLLRSHGITRDALKMTHAPDGPWYYQQLDLGYNYRMTELQAALGISQMSRVDEYVARRHELAAVYASRLSQLPVITPWQHSDAYSAFHLYIIQIDVDNTAKSRSEVFSELLKNHIGVNLHYIPVHLQPYYENLGFKLGDFPVAEAYYGRALSIPLFPGLTPDQQNHIINTLYGILGS